MSVCPSCAKELPDDARFCSSCGSAVAAQAAAARASGTEERKTITVLFCDLVAFTAMGEAADPEDVEAVLVRYHEAARREIERHGGVVEKFIGDAVVGVFGVPAVHEDDAERAVRAGLRVLESLAGMTRPDGEPLEARIGVNTGEALVHLGVDPASGRGFLAGDAVNTAARLQAAAPAMGVVAGAATQARTANVIRYEAFLPVAAKGKAERVAVWRAVAPVSRLGAELSVAAVAMIGRELELAYLDAVVDKAVRSREPQFVLISGEPGIGKSRLVAEALRLVDARTELVTWRQGTCRPYGDGRVFGALADIVRAHAGVLESDNATQIEGRLGKALSTLPDREWVGQRLRPLLGLDAPPADASVNRAAWALFLEGLARARPAVLVFEDLHFADEALLDFLDDLAGREASAALVVLGTARPELFERRPSFLAPGTRVHRIELGSLSPVQAGALAAALLGPDDDAAEVARRCGGNPYFIQESVKLLEDNADASKLPATVEAVIAARLDALSREQKAVMAGAAVVGDVFWAEVVAALEECETEAVEQVLDALIGKQLVRRRRTSSLAGEREYAFVHTLAREVAYQTLPRRARATRHLAAARWLRGRSDDRVEDAAGIAHHLTTAFGLLTAVRDTAGADVIREEVAQALALAGARAQSLDAVAAERYYAEALAAAGPGSALRPRLLAEWAEILDAQELHPADVAAALEEAVPGLLEQGEVRRAAVALTVLGTSWEKLGQPVNEYPEVALELLEGDEPSPELVTVLSRVASLRWYSDPAGGERYLEDQREALEMARLLGLPEPPELLGNIAVLRCSLGDLGGVEDARRAVRVAREQGLVRACWLASFALVVLVECIEGPGPAVELIEEAEEYATRHGMRGAVDSWRGFLAEALALAGRWDEALAEASASASTLDEAGHLLYLAQALSMEAVVLCWRGDLETAARALEWLEVHGVRLCEEDSSYEAYCLPPLAFSAYQRGRDEEARRLLHGTTVWCSHQPDVRLAAVLPEGMRVAVATGAPEAAAHLIEDMRPVVPAYAHILVAGAALLAEARGDVEDAAAGFADAARRWHDFGVPYEEGHAQFGLGRCLVALGRAPEAAAPLAAARGLFARLGAVPALVDVDRWLAKVEKGGGAEV